MTPTVRSKTRSLTLAAALGHGSLAIAWKNTVRHGLRRQGLGDVHDYLDVHRRLHFVVQRLHNEVVAGGYRPRGPEHVTVEKKIGITRRVVIPSPEDAILLQALIDSIERRVLAAAPTDRAFYSRSHKPPSVYDVDSTFPYPWWELWPEFQRRIWSFARDRPFVAVTDIANYFDSIPLQTLRNRLVSLAHLREELVDFLFLLLEHMEWRPNYIPSNGVGLPQIQFDAPRLLAHAYLYEVDEFLRRRSKASMVRWMDDMNIGVESREDGKRVLLELDEMLSAMRLRLNTGKSRIYSGQELLRAIWINENRRLNGIDAILDAKPQKAVQRAKQCFGRVWRSARIGSWDKVMRRYFTVFTRLGDSALEPIAPDVLRDCPGIRDKVFRYYTVLGYSAKRFRHVENYLRSGACVDEWSLYAAFQVVTSWDIPLRSPYRSRATHLGLEVWRARRDNHVATAATASILAKFASARALSHFVRISNRTWRRSEWAARQVAGLTPLMGSDAKAIRETVATYGLRDGMEVLVSLGRMRRLRTLDPQMRSYLFQPTGDYPYPFSKAVVGVALLQGDLEEPDRSQLVDHFITAVDDRTYRKWARTYQ